MSKANGGFQPAGRAPAPPPLDLVQDFVNTEIPEWARDDIASPELLDAWLRSRGLLGGDDVVDASVFVAARSLRAVLRRLALANTLDEPPGSELRAELERVLSGLQFAVTLDESGQARLGGAGTGAGRALAEIVARVVEAQSSGQWRRLKACRKESCGWLFYDGSRNVSSTWCSMSICGNRTKTAAYRRRQRA